MVNQLKEYEYAKYLPEKSSIGGTITTEDSHVHLSFGYPNSDLFPLQALSEAASEAILSGGHLALHYFGGDGINKTKQWIKESAVHRSIEVDLDQILTTSGAQHAIDVAARTLINTGDEVWVEAPTFFGATQAFQLAGAKITSFPIDRNGLVVDEVEAALKKRKAPKFIYIMPNFHNPGGVNLSQDRREKLAKLAEQYSFYILEDDAYGELSFTTDYQPSVYSYAPSHVIYIGTFSKIIGPGVRIGWIIAKGEVLSKLNIFLQGSQTNPLTQEILAQLFTKLSFQTHLTSLIDDYRVKRDVMVEALQQTFQDHISFHIPEGGFFIWVRFKKDIDTDELAARAFRNGVSIVPGTSFYQDNRPSNEIRLCFTYCDAEQIKRGVRILADTYFSIVKSDVEEIKA
ncbi:aminotransferase-like domain-containing protein [Alkalicoccobacillus murimartini]|uniref:2-aminoadipate transaminase n=1 Tax=Alkalicoccobacillus murimartini TaxID=171685 RepID=A0ABT9YHE5_9BACI|nr:PLP-dependent aminotransferase family protein [Alkalicoccobacillus murimartini]MDQ0206941.1 2-aminoadipate transaminase [Alkalicoccobacillus murimartini]